MIDNKTFEKLATLSKIDFTEAEQAMFSEDLYNIIKFIGKVREFQGEYDDVADNSQITYSDLREDTAKSVATPEQLLANTESVNNCYVIPRVVD